MNAFTPYARCARYLILILFFIRIFPCAAQKEHRVWHFGFNGGIRFDNDTVVAISGGAINSREGCATISSSTTGNLLFYTDGTRVWDRTHNIMPNGSGLQGDYSSAQSAVIIPFPNDTNRYYIFTTATAKGMYYSVVNMTLNSGRGDIVTGAKNLNLVSSSAGSEKLCATKHCNDSDYWVVTHLVNNNRFYVYRVSSTGVSGPSIYATGTSFTVGGWMEAAQLKISIDGKKLANAIGPYTTGSTSNVEIFDFNNSTGAISGSPITLSSLGFPYGVEFSPNGRFLYVTELAGQKVSQYDLTASNVNSSRQVLASSSNLLYGSLQLGPDGRIYVSAEDGYNVGYAYLSVIKKPDLAGSSCQYTSNYVNLGSGRVLIGLPGIFGPSYINKFRLSGPQEVCVSTDSVRYVVDNYKTGSTVSWQLKSAGSGLFGQNDSSAYVRFGPNEGTDTLVITYSSGCGSYNYTSVLPVKIKGVKPRLGKDTSLCAPFSISLDAGISNARYLWSTGSNDTLKTKTVNSAGTYWVKATNSCGIAYDTISVSKKDSVPDFDLGKDTSFCDSVSLTLQTGVTGFPHSWSTTPADTFPALSVTSAGFYKVTVTSACNTKKDSIRVWLKHSPVKPSIGKDTSVCTPFLLVLNAGIDSVKYLWSTGPGDTLKTLAVSDTGSYYVSVTNACATAKDTMKITSFAVLPVIDIGKDTVFCNTMPPLTLAVQQSGFTYKWSTGPADTLQSKTVSQPGKYWVNVTNQCGLQSDTIELKLLYSPAPKLQGDTSLCLPFSLTLHAGMTADKYLWSSAATDTNQQVLVSSPGTYWVRVTNYCGSAYDTVVISSPGNVPPFSLGKDTVLCDTSLSIDLNVPLSGYKFRWSHIPADTNHVVIDKTGLYILSVSNLCDTLTDSFSLAYLSAPDHSLGNDTTVCGEFEINLSIPHGYIALWEDGSQENERAIHQPGVYIVNIGNSCGSMADTLEVILGTSSLLNFMPNTFTPNGDSINDLYPFDPATLAEEFSRYYLVVFNRWGEKIFETETSSVAWDGRYKARDCPEGVYFFQVGYKTCDGKLKNLSGVVHLIR